MKIGVIGLGKLGLPLAKAIEAKGHEVLGNDIVKTAPIQQATVPELLSWADLIFVVVQTPHDPDYEGVTRLPQIRVDFDYSHLRKVLEELSDLSEKRHGAKAHVVIVSTCLPGTFDREFRSLSNSYIEFLYSPAFTAMGTVAEDLYNAEFNIIGTMSEGIYSDALNKLCKFYESINNAKNVITNIRTAEAAKVAYNTFVTAKTVLGNLWGEISEKMVLDFETIYKTWQLADKRLLSDRYLDAGMADGGACHPRDNIAMSYIAREIGLSYDYFESLMIAREEHTAWLANLAVTEAQRLKLPIIILGRGFKPESDIETGSPSKLLLTILSEHMVEAVNVNVPPSDGKPAVFFIGTKTDWYASVLFPKGSTVIDPFRYIPNREGVTVIRIGEGIHHAGH